jgi:putative ABC transport system permease protein
MAELVGSADEGRLCVAKPGINPPMALPLIYNWRNLLVRKLSTTLTFTVVTLIVAVLAVLLSFAAGIRASLGASGSALNVVALQTGATAESTSIVRPNESARLIQTPGVRRNAAGEPMISQELCVQTNIPRRSAGGAQANVAVRGVDPTAFDVHPEVKLIEGRMFESGPLEVIVGNAARDRFMDLQVGGHVVMGKTSNRSYKVVGVFEAGGGALESEIWAGRTTLSDSFDRRFVSSVVLRLEEEAQVEDALHYIQGPVVKLKAKRELDYYADLASKSEEIVLLTTILITLMAIGAVFAVANTMYAAVDGRRREIAMLRTLGFSRTAIISSFLVESLLVCLTACAVGLLMSSFVTGTRQDYLSDTTWTVLAYELKMTPQIILAALALSTFVGVTGALAPAVRASRTRIIEALRKA